MNIDRMSGDFEVLVAAIISNIYSKNTICLSFLIKN